ncbi:MAG TPA: Nif3-like dinuclear metal center hexameric protein [Balneolales bacterium]|nr:Nif3-like dinuclear metal center hexameric protein [Balneolales bacterium]
MTVKVSHINNYIEAWAPSSTKLDYDNVGVLFGSPDHTVNKILLSLDLTPEVVDEAVQKGCDLILTHHPIIFRGIKSINSETLQGKSLYLAIHNDIALIAAHTNLDAAKGGVSYALAETLGLRELAFLSEDYYKRRQILARIEKIQTSQLRNELQRKFGLIPLVLSGDDSGKKALIEVTADNWQVSEVMATISRFTGNGADDIQVLKTERPTPSIGMGVVGAIPGNGMAPGDFLDHIASKLNLKAFRYTGHPDLVQKVAVCGGAGVSMVTEARKKGAQALVTADVKYHDFFLDDPSFLLIDVGHYESEIPIVPVMQRRLQEAFPEVEVIPTSVRTNPMNVHLHPITQPNTR